MRIALTHRLELQPNNSQEALFRQYVGVAQFAFNQVLAEWERQYKASEKPNEVALHRQFKAIKLADFPLVS